MLGAYDLTLIQCSRQGSPAVARDLGVIRFHSKIRLVQTSPTIDKEYLEVLFNTRIPEQNCTCIKNSSLDGSQDNGPWKIIKGLYAETGSTFFPVGSVHIDMFHHSGHPLVRAWCSQISKPQPITCTGHTLWLILHVGGKSICQHTT